MRYRIFILLFLLLIPLCLSSYTLSGGLNYTSYYGFGSNFYMEIPIANRIGIIPAFVKSEIHKTSTEYYAYSGYSIGIDYDIPLDYLHKSILSKIDYMFFSYISLGVGVVRFHCQNEYSDSTHYEYQRFFNSLYIIQRNGIDLNSVISIENVNYISVFKDITYSIVFSPSINLSITF